MAYRHSGLEQLAKARARGQRPDLPVVIADSATGGAWSARNGFFVIDRADVGEDLTAFVGLDVWIRTARPFTELLDLAFALCECARYVTLVCARGERRSEFVSSVAEAA